MKSCNHLDGIRAVVFDAVGTLLEPDPKPAVVYSEIGKRHGSKLPLAVVTSGFREAFDAQERHDVTLSQVTDETRELARWRAIVGSVLHDLDNREACFHDLWRHFARPASWRLVSGAAALFASFRELNLKIAVASNFDGRLRSVLAGFPESRLLHDIVISSEVGWRKPAPEFFAELCRRLASNPDQILFVGDSRGNDYEAPRRAGLRALLLDPAGRHAQSNCRRIEKLAELLG